MPKSIACVLAVAAVLMAAAVPPSIAQRILIDHRSVSLFEQIPPRYAEAARELRLLFMDRSVGGNISDALSCLSHAHAAAPSFCKRYTHRDAAYAVDPREVYWDGVWDRSQWRYEFWPAGCAEDSECFVRSIEPRIDSFDVVGFQFSYLAVMPGSNLVHPVDGFFGSRSDRGTATRYTEFAARHPDKTVIWWTTSLARGIGSAESRVFNTAMREYARVHDLVLFDVADILSHDPSGQPCFDNRDGVAYLDENHPDDGDDIPAICPQYTTETEGGHLGSISAGGIRVAKAFWVLMARIAGWDGSATGVADQMVAPGARRPTLAVAPNPVTDRFSVTFTLPHASEVEIAAVDVLGRVQDVVYRGEEQAGTHRRSVMLRSRFPRGAVRYLRLRSQDGITTAIIARVR